MKESALFACRIWFYDQSQYVVECWADELLPMTFDKRSIAEWAESHLKDCHDSDGLREVLGVPAEGDHQVFFKAKMLSWKSGPPGEEEWDESFEIEGVIQQAPIPKEYGMFYVHPAWMQWSKEIPTEEGYYWFRSSPERSADLVSIKREDDGILYQEGIWDIRHARKFHNRQWAGPIPQPVER